MEDRAVEILEQHGVMALATLRPDGWPQATIVSYVSERLILYFLISRTSQKFANIVADPRVSIAIGSEASTPSKIEGLSIAAQASESRDEPYRSEMLAKLSARHPGYFDPASLALDRSALIRAVPSIISVVDFSRGLGHTDLLSVGADQIVESAPMTPDNWGPKPAPSLGSHFAPLRTA